MTDFVAEVRHYCRNPRCRSKLPAPVANARDAFCTRGCHSGFYRTRCLVCEAKMARRTENQLICGKRRCRNALQARQSFGRYHASSAVVDPVKTSIKPGIKTGVANARAWRIVAGPEISIEARNRAMLREHFRRLGAKAQIQRHHAPVNVLGGYRFPDAPEIDLSPIATAAPAPTARAVVGDGLDIPGFLLRRRAA
jgi:hypothetical protein